MKTGALPKYDAGDNTAGCCPRFIRDRWNEQQLHFEDKLFIRVNPVSDGHLPVDIDEVFPGTSYAITNADARYSSDLIVLTRDVSESAAGHYLSVAKPVPGQDNVRLNGDCFTNANS